MQCDCLETIKKHALEKFEAEGKFKKPILDASFSPTTFMLVDNTMSITTVTHLDVRLEGRKSKVQVTVAHTFCPFCGQPVRPEQGSAAA